MKKIRVGLLPLYIKLYDDIGSTARDRLEPFYDTIAAALEDRGLEVLKSPFCRVKEEFEAAVRSFEEGGARALVTLNMAYSPSLESIDAIAGSRLPVVVLDTTETYDFSPMQDPGEISYCHGIHGVMDLCSLLRQRGKPYAISAGHWQYSPVLDRTAGFVRTAVAAQSLKGLRVGRFGGAFKGMGDFAVTAEELKDCFGVTLVEADAEELKALGASVTEEEISSEMALDAETMTGADEVDPVLYRESVRACLTTRKWIEAEKLGAFTVNFLGVSPKAGLNSMPFPETCKAMARGVGYAGEGDVLTAAFCGAILQGNPSTSFVEIFCPDWNGGTLLLSHMGEMNYKLADSKPHLKAAGTNYTDGAVPVAGYARYRAGRALYMNVCRDEKGFKLVSSPVEMVRVSRDAFGGSIRGWMRPAGGDVAGFLERLSRAGATHHSLLMYNASPEQAQFFADLLRLRHEVV